MEVGVGFARVRKAARYLATVGIALAGFLGLVDCVSAQEPPYAVTYSHALEEPGNLEIATKNLQAAPAGGSPFLSTTLELEYGATAWWTTELYLSGQSTAKDSTVFTAYRWENRVRPLLREHWINPVLYVEYEHLNGADRSILEVVGNDGVGDLIGKNAELRKSVEHSIETKLILSSNVRGWNFSENIIAEKSLANKPWEFGYALGASRPFALEASSKACVFCRENFSGGAELYGGLGTRHSFGLHDTSHYAGPTVMFNIPKGPSITFSPNFGLNANSAGVLYRFKISYEIQQVFGGWRK